MSTSKATVAYFVVLVILAFMNNLVFVPMAKTTQATIGIPQNSTVNNTTADKNVTIEFSGVGDILTNPLAIVLIIGAIVVAAAVIATPKGLGSGADRGGVATAAFAATMIAVLILLLSGVYSLFTGWPANLGIVAFGILALTGIGLILVTALNMLAGSS